MRKNYRITSLFMVIVMFLASVSFVSFFIPTIEAAALEGTISDDALHFYIRHWHSDMDDEALYQGSSNSNEEGDKDRYFVLVEGYIQPVANGEGYEFYMVNQQEGTLIKYGDGIGEDEMVFTDSPYIESVDEKEGIIVLSRKPLMDGDEAVERYAGLSISVGRNAVEYLDNGLQIRYNPYIHLVKGHAFYTPLQMIVNGAVATTVDGDAVTFEGLFTDPETDTAYVYTYLKSTTVSGREYKAGDIVMSVSDPDQACVSESDLPAGLQVGTDVQLSKFYSTVEGMHTDKTIEATGDDGRTFTSNLDVWYVEGHAPNVSLILDASGSMVAPTDNPTIISVYDTDENGNKIFRTDIKASIEDKIGKLNDYDNSNAVEWDEVFLTDEELATLLNTRNTDNSMVGVSGYNYYVYGGSDYAPLGYWEGVQAISDPIVQMPFDKDGHTGALRDWLYNTASNKDAIKVNKASSEEWESNTFDFDTNLPIDWNNGDTTNFSFSAGDGLRVTNSNTAITDMRDTYQYSVKMDATPTGGNFTISFTLRTKDGDTGSSDNRLAQLLYIGPGKGDNVVPDEDGNNNYYALYRANSNSSNRLKGTQQSNAEGYAVSNVNDVFSKADTYTVTLVFENATSSGGTVNTYINGSISNSEVALKTPLPADDLCIVLNGVDDYYDGRAIYIDDFTVYNEALSVAQVSDLVNGSSGRGTTVAQRGDGKTLGSINTSSSDWDKTPSTRTSNNTTYTMSQTQAGWYYITHAGRFFNHYNLYANDDRGGTGKRLLGINGGYNNGLAIEDNAIVPHASGSNDPIGTGYTYTSTKDEPTRFYLDKEGNLRCFYGTGTGVTAIACSYVYNLTDAQYVRTEVLRRAIGLFVTDLNAESPAAKVSAVRFSTQDINYNTVGTTDKFEMLLLQDWTSDTIESTGMLSMNYGADSQKDGLPFVIGGARAYDYSTSRPKGQGDVKQYNYGLTGSTTTWSGIQSYINTLADTADPDAPKYLIIFTDGADDYIGNTTDTIKIKKGKDAAITSVPAGNAAKELTDYLKGEDYTIFTVLLDGDSMKEGTESFEKAKTFLTSLSGREGLTDKENEKYFFSINLSVTGKMDELVQELLEEIKGNYESEEAFQNAYRNILKDKKEEELTYSDLIGDKDKEIVDKAYEALDIHTTDLLTDIFTNEVLKEIVSPLEGYTVKDYIDPRFDLQTKNGTVWHLNAGGQVVIGDGKDENSTFTVSADSTRTFHLSGTTDFSARTPYLRYDAEKDMYYLEWVEQTIPTSAVGADRLAIWTAQVILKAKDDFIGGNAILTDGNEENMNWVYHPGDLESEKNNENSEYEYDPLNPFGFDASSGTDDMKRIEFVDAYPSKGFPRTTVNVQLLPINTNDQDDVIYMGEAVSPKQLLSDIEGDYITDSYYLEYLKRYAYQIYDKQSDPDKKAQMDMPLLDLLTDWLEIGNENVLQKEFSVPYSYLPSVKYDDDTGKVVLNGDKASVIYNNTGGKIHEQDVVGILTYRWEQLDPDPKSATEPIRDFVKDDTEQLIYSLTVEFTPLRVGDTLALLDSAVETTDETTADGIPIAAAVEIDGGDDIPARARDGIFASYVTFNGDKAEFDENYLFDREKYLNGDSEVSGGYALITDADYKWNKVYKPTEDGTEQIADIPLDDPNYPYGDATFLNIGRTLTAFSQYTLDAVSGDIILELKLLIGELEKAAENAGYTEVNGENHFITTFTLDAERSFTDTDAVEKIKSDKANAVPTENWEDYAASFEFTFELDYTDEQIEDLRESLDDPDADPNGYVTVYAKARSIKVDYGYGEAEADTWEEKDLASIAELPIGTYVFSLDRLEQEENNILHFSTMEHEDDSERFVEATDYFDKLVMRGLNTTNEKPEQKWLEIEVEGEKVQLSDPEITEANIAGCDDCDGYIAEAKSDGETATFYIGTSSETDPKRGNTDDTERLYTDYRLGIIRLTTGMTRLTVKEKGAQDNESFLYRVIGTTYGDKEVDLIISVKGEGSTTVEILPGEYTVIEISDDTADWSWRYQNKSTYGETNENWTVEDNLKEASTDLWHSANEPELKEHKTVTFEHERNDKVWLGGESHKNNIFGSSDTETE